MINPVRPVLMILALVLASPLFGTAFLSGQQAETAPDRLEQANQMISEGRISEAVTLLTSYKQDRPLDAHGYFLTGLAYFQTQNWVRAAFELKEAVSLAPENPEYAILYANVLTHLGQNEAAVESLAVLQHDEQIEKLTTAWAWVMSDTLYRAGSNDGALKVLDHLARRNPEDPRVDLNRGQVYYVKGDHESARKSIETCLSKQPENNPGAYYELGRILEQLGDSEGAKEAYTRAVQQDEGNSEYLWKLGAVTLALGEPDEAIRYLEMARSDAETFPEIYYVLGRAYQAARNREKAMECLKRFQQISGVDRKEEYDRIEAGKLVGKGEDALNRGDTEEAEAFFKEALETNPGNWAANGYLAELYLGLNRLEQASQYIQKLREIDSNHPVGMYLAARYWYRQNDLERARQLAEQVRVERPSNPELRNLLGNIYFGLNMWEESFKEYRAAVALAPDRPEFRMNLEAVRKHLPNQ